MTDIEEKAIETVARAQCPPGTADDWVEVSPDGKGIKRRWQMFVPEVKKVVALYEAAMWQDAEAEGDGKEWLIRKGGLFYRPNRAGYTSSKAEAGRYTQDEAEREARIEPRLMAAVHQSRVADEPAYIKGCIAGQKAMRERAARLFEEQAEMVPPGSVYEQYAVSIRALPIEGERAMKEPT